MNNHQNPAFHSLDNLYQTSFRTTRADLIEYHQLSKNHNSVNHPYLCKGLRVNSNMRILLLLLFLPLFCLAYDKTSFDIKPIHITGNSYYVEGKLGSATQYEGFIANAGFVITKDGVVVFDALGTEALADAMITSIKKITNKPIKLVITSHYHADHIYGLASYKRLGAKVWAPKGSLEYYYSNNAEQLLIARKDLLFPWLDDDTKLIKPDRIITKDIEFSLGEVDFIINYFGSIHSSGDMSLLVKNDQVLFSGDIIFVGRIPFVGDADINKWLKILTSLENTKVEYLVPGHGKMANSAKNIISDTKNYLEFLLTKLTPAVNDMLDFDTTYKSINWGKFANMPTFNEANRKNAYAVYLYLERTLE